LFTLFVNTVAVVAAEWKSRMSVAVPGQAVAARILVVDQDAGAVRRLGSELADLLAVKPVVTAALSGRSALEHLRRDGCDALVVSLDAVGDLGEGMEDAMARLCRSASDAIVVALSDARSVTATLAAMSSGAHDCLSHPVSGRALAARLAELAERHGRARAIGFAPKPVAEGGLFGLIGTSSQMQVVFEQIERIATSNAPVFITGEVGTGKTFAAGALHRAGPRAGLPFIVAGSGDGELAALAARVGLGRATLFIDEIGDMSHAAQGLVLELLDRHGADTAEAPRFICATRDTPLQLVAERRLREDLFYRLHVLPLNLPPLRQRTGDAVLLAEHFLARFAAEEQKGFTGFSAEARLRLGLRDWPGNVRQLQTLVRRLVVMHSGGEISAEMLDAADFESSARARASGDTGTILPMWRQEQRIIEDAISRCNGNIALAAQALELSPSTIYRKRQAWAELEARQGAA
jgi:two-component system repressor protein LuxO